MLKNEGESVEEKRYDAQAVQKMVALAAQLEQNQQETMTASQVEAIGADVGLDPAFVRKALEQFELQETAKKSTGKQSTSSKTGSATSGVLRTREELRAWIAAFAIPVLHAIAAYAVISDGSMADDMSPHAVEVAFLVVSPILLSWLPGYLTGRKRAGILSGIWYGLCMMSAALVLHPVVGARSFQELVTGFAALSMVPEAILSTVGAWVRARISPPKWLRDKDPSDLDRQAMLDRFFALQQELESHNQHRAFLSIDVAGSTQMKQSAPELAVEFSFNAYRQWIEETVRRNGGEMQTAAGDGVMCIFRNDADAVRTAQQLQQGITAFNTKHNRLPLPFRIRCGVNAGSVAILDGMPIGHLQSAVIDRAAILQKMAQPGGIEIDPSVNVPRSNAAEQSA